MFVNVDVCMGGKCQLEKRGLDIGNRRVAKVREGELVANLCNLDECVAERHEGEGMGMGM